MSNTRLLDGNENEKDKPSLFKKYFSFNFYKETFNCSICMEDIQIENDQNQNQMISSTLLHNHLDKSIINHSDNYCTQTFCKACIINYLTFEIKNYNGDNKNKSFYTIKCPGNLIPKNNNYLNSTPCQGLITDDFIQKLVEPSVFEKYKTFQTLKIDPTSRLCPNCDCLVLASGRENNETNKITIVIDSGRLEDEGKKNNKNSLKKNEMFCSKCSISFCSVHSNAHDPSKVTCEEYNKSIKKQIKQDEAFIDQTSVKCPSCSAPIFKSNGCNHMRCAVCNQEFCYLCGGRYLKGLHFNRYNLLGCPNLQHFQAPNDVANYRGSWQRKLCRITCLPFFLLFGVIVPLCLLFVFIMALNALWIIWFVFTFVLLCPLIICLSSKKAWDLLFFGPIITKKILRKLPF